METRQLIICRGIQGSGKTTHAKQWCREDPEHRIRINNDDIRSMLGDYWVPNRESIVAAAYNAILNHSMEKGYNIIVDNMNLNPQTCAELVEIVMKFNKNNTYDWQYEIEYKDFFIPVEECILRDATRPNPIGEKVIRQTWRKYRNFIIRTDMKNMLNKVPKHVDGGHPIILVDMDGTLCLNTTGRPYFGEGAAEGMLDDVAIEGTCMLVRRMYEKCKIFIVTGREGTPEIIAATKKWLSDNNISVDKLFFRPVNDYSSSADCKKKIYEDSIKGKYNVQFVLEDNYKCVEMFRSLGLTVLQPNEGKF